MNDGRIGIARLRESVDRVAATLPAPGRARRRRVSLPRVVLLAAAILVVALMGVWTLRKVSGPPAAPRVEVRLLRVRGRDVEARVFESAKAGTIVVAPKIVSASRAGLHPAVALGGSP